MNQTTDLLAQSPVQTGLTPGSCRELLKAVIDPELYQNIVDLGLIYDVTVSTERDVTVTMTYTTPLCPMGAQIKENVEKTLRAAGANDVMVKVVFQPQWDVSMMTEELQRVLGLLDEQPEEEEQVLPPPPPPKQPEQKKGVLGRLFGW